jgi:hypothetical protein
MGNQIVSNTPSPHPDQNIKPTCAYQRSAQTYLEKRAKGDDYTYGHLGLQLFLKYVWMCRSALHPNKFGENMKTHQVKEVTITYISSSFLQIFLGVPLIFRAMHPNKFGEMLKMHQGKR